MFFDPQRIHSMRRMILADTPEAREAALADLLPYQREDFVGIFKAMAGLPVTIRLLDPPLHEFLPRDAKDQQALADEMGVPIEQVRQRIDRLAEMNPMLGHRGCRLAISHPEILRMQVRAIAEAAAICRKEKIKVLPEVMIPLVMAAGELEHLKGEHLKGDITDFRLGVMIETPRAALIAGELARGAEFFSFGTNDLTQLTYGISRDDAGRFLPEYVQKGVFPADPFASLDQSGVGELMRMALAGGRLAHPGLKCGLCGEHGGDPASIDFCHRIGLDYVSCSPHRLPIARLAAAQATIRAGNPVMQAR
jgi:pyruvate,orthophosphate dikinase